MTCKERRCNICNTVYMPTGHCSKYCDACKPTAYRETQSKNERAYRERNGSMVGVGKGGNPKYGKDNPSWSTGISVFQKESKRLKQEVNMCQWCGKSLTDASRWEWCVHHTDHDRTNNTPDNFVLLCKRCHQVHHECHKSFEKGATTKLVSSDIQRTGTQQESVI